MRAQYVVTAGILSLLTVGLWQRHAAQSADESSLGAFWKPTRDEVAVAVKQGPGKWDDERHDRFTALFTQRYRRNGLAVRARYADNCLVNLQCGATIPRWQ